MRSLPLLSLSVALAGCLPPRAWVPPAVCPALDEPSAAAAPAGPHRTRNLILIAVDGTRWEEVFQGTDPALAGPEGLPVVGPLELLPNIYRRLVDGGVALGAPGHGRPMSASGPSFTSLPGYQELLGGRPTRCRNNRCAAIDRPTLLDEARAALGLAPGQVAAIASWERMERATSVDNRTLAVSAGRHHGASRDRLRVDPCTSALLDEGARAGAAPGLVDYRPDRYTGALALAYLQAERPRLLFVGLGDTDEYGHQHDYAGHLEALRALDRFVGALFARLDRLGAYGAETTVVLTTDHGWSHDFWGHGAAEPESGRVWLLAAGGAVPSRGVVEAALPHTLADVAPTVRALLGLPPDHTAGAGAPIPELLPPPPVPAAFAARE